MSILSVFLPLFTSIAPQQPVDASLTQTAPAAAVVAAPAALPRALASFGAAAIDARVFVYGGHVGRAHAHSRDNQVGELLAFDRSAPQAGWQVIGNGPALQSPALVAFGGRLVRIGGMAARNAAGEDEDLWSVAEVASFDPALGQWQALPPLPEARSSHDAVVVGEHVLVIGGWQLAGAERRWLDTAWQLDLSAPQDGWQALPAAPFRRRALAVAAVGERVFALGGIDEHGDVSDRVDQLELRSGTWSVAPALPKEAFGAAAIGLDGALYASARSGELWRLHSGGWQVANSLLLARFFHRFVPGDRGELIAIAGAGKAHLHTCEVVPTRDDTLHVQRWRVPVDHPARNRQAFAVLGDTLYMAGGNCGKQQHDFAPEHFTAEVVAVDLRTMRSTKVAPLPAPRQSQPLLADGKTLLTVGGFAHSGGGGRSQADGARLDVTTGAWQAIAAALPEPRTQFGIARAAGSLWLLGGIDYAPDRKGSEFVYPPALLRSNDDGTFANTELRMPRSRRAFGCAAVGDRIWLVGGMREGFAPVPEVDVFDAAAGTWQDGPAPAARVSPFLFALGDTLVLAGGSVEGDEGLERARTLSVLAAGEQRWRELPLPIDAAILGGAVHGERLLLVTRDADALQVHAVSLPRELRADLAR